MEVLSKYEYGAVKAPPNSNKEVIGISSFNSKLTKKNDQTKFIEDLDFLFQPMIDCLNNTVNRILYCQYMKLERRNEGREQASGKVGRKEWWEKQKS